MFLHPLEDLNSTTTLKWIQNFKTLRVCKILNKYKEKGKKVQQSILIPKDERAQLITFTKKI